MKCEGCPCNSDAFGWCGAFDDSVEDAVLNCHLTEADQRIINAMIAGEWRCDTCRYGPTWEDNSCAEREQPCANWQPKGGE